MIRQLCPNCATLVELPDDAAGAAVACPRCAKMFAVPAAYTPAVDPAAGPPVSAAAALAPVPDRPAPPPGYVPPGYEPPPAAAAAGPTAPPVSLPTPDGYTHSAGVVLSPAVVAWVPVAALTVVVALSFFPWVGSYPGGVRLYSQLPWQAAFGYFSASPIADDELALKPHVASNGWLLLYVLLLVPTLFLAWAERLIRTPNPSPAALPGPLAWLAVVWPVRFALLTALTVLLLVLLGLQTWRGFGLERAVEALATQKHEADLADAKTTAKELVAAVKVGQEVGRFALDGTTAFAWAVLAHVAAVAGVVGLWWLDRRGPKPAPQARAYW